MTPRVLFIGGAGRSGSTLLERLLARANAADAMGEVMHLWQRGIVENQLCGCGTTFHECPFWSQVGDHAFGGWEQVDTTRMAMLKDEVDKARRIPQLRSGLGSRKFKSNVREYAGNFHRLYQAAHEVTGNNTLIDSSKQVSLPFVLHRGPVDLRVIQLVRDPRGVAYSWTKSVVRPEITDDQVLMPKYRPSRTAGSWVVHNAGFSLLPHSEVPVLRVRHENLVSDPETTVKVIADFADISLPSDLLGQLRSGFVHLGSDHSVAGNPIRFAEGDLYLRPDSDWRKSLAPADRRAVTVWTWPWLAAYGYLGREDTTP